MSCLVLTKEIKELASKFPNETEASILTLVELWQEENNKSIEDVPTKEELTAFISKTRGKYIPTYYTGNITPEKDTIFVFGSNPEGRHGARAAKTAREQFGAIYGQGEGLQGNSYALPTKRIRNMSASYKGKMTFSYEDNKRDDVQSSTTFEAIINGERTATTRYITDGNIDYWRNVKVGDIIAFEKAGGKGNVFVRVTKPLTQLSEDTNAEEWSKKEGWSVAYYESKVKPKVLKGQAFQMEYEFVDANGERTITPQQIIENIKKLYETARQNPDKQFKVAYRNIEKTSLNGYTGLEMIDMFLKAGSIPSNIVFSKEWVDTGKFNPVFNNEKRRSLEDSMFYDKKSEEENYESTISSLDKRRAIDFTFDPVTRRNRVSLLSRLFSNKITSLMEEARLNVQSKIDNPEFTDEEKEQLADTLKKIDRMYIIREYGPAGIFNKIKEDFIDYVESDEETRISLELDAINNTKGAEKYSEEIRRNAATRRASYKFQEFQKIVDYFELLAEEASVSLSLTEKIKINLESEYTPKITTPEKVVDNDTIFDDDSFEDAEETVKDGWMTNYREVSSHDSLSLEVRKVINNIPRLDYKGKYEKDDLGNNVYLDPNYVHAVLIDKLRNMVTASDMLPLLKELAKTKLWVKQVINTLEQDEVLFSKFYQDFRKDFTQYWIQKRIPNSDGTFRVQTISLNQPEGVYYLLDSWRDNYESGTILTKDSIYNNKGEIKTNKANIGLEETVRLTNLFQNKDTESMLKALEDEETFNSIVTLLHMIGADVNQSTLRTALTTVKDNEFVKYTHPVLLLLNNLNIIFSGVVANKIETTVDDNGVIKKGDLINTFGSAYNNIANMLAEVTEDAIESSIRENGKSYYAHNTPAYLGKLIKNLKNVSGDKERFMRYIQEEFKQYEWFFRGGKWNNGWLELLESNPEYRKMLDHKVVLNYDKREYTDWDSLDYTLILLNEYWSDPGKTKDTAWYHLPILSDAPSAEFIKFRRYSDRNIDEYDDSGKKLTYQDVLLEKFASLVSQEYSRIMLVRKRDALIQETKDPSIALANYDIKRDSKTGEIVNIGGAEFKFLPQLNTLRDENGVLFLDKLLQLARDKKSLEVKEFIKTSLQTIMDESFEEEYAKWDSMGMFEELPNGKMKHIPFSGQASKVSNIIKALNEARNIIGESFTKDMFSLLDAYSNGKPVKDKDALEVFSSIKSVITEKLVRKEITNEQFQSINSKLKLNNPAKEALREYYWNSKYATSQIIQLTTTDLAFYSSMEDFQKRFKEVHTPSLRLNTKSKYGREFERTIYLKDDEIVSNVANHIEELILDRHNNGELSAFEAASIISKYGISNFKDSKGKEYYKIGDTMVKTSHINVADAQAYRSLSSYRAILDMSGQWTDEMDTAYNNITSGNWTYNDFSVLWQPKKPFVYTQVNNNSGIEGRSGIKTPVQHKNSEFLLLAMYDAIAGATGQSSKLKALNIFMEKHQIDVVQFESTTKVGKQGVLNINDLNDEKEIINFLETATGIAAGKENPNFIHTISYEDYGISTATPEHFIDAIQSLGTQIRKLITADISDGAIIDVGGVKKTKQEWLDLYNRVVTENIIQSFVEVDEIFKNTKEIEKVIKEEIRNNPKYGAEMLKACSLNKDGLFNIPLHDPVQSQMVQQLLTSIIKNRITKQKTKGGSLIQVSSYGLSDKLNIVFEGKGKNKRIKYFECYMPAYSKKFFEHLIDENGQLDVSKLPDDLRKLIGYRIPTEDKYSIVPLYIKGFLPPQSGSAIMLPAEITTISGSDFDVDKLYIIAPEFRVVEYDYDSARKDYARMGELVSDLFSNFNQGEHSFGDLSEIEDESFNNWFKENKEKYRLQKPTFRKVKYNHNKEAKDNSREARNNLILDAMWGVLTNPDTATKILNPGGFDKQKRAARICAILEGMSKKQLIDILNTEYGFKLKYTDSVAKAILSLDYDAIDKIKRRLASSIDPLAPSTQVMFHQYNTGGGKMIGVYANHNASHAFIQHTNLSIHPENGGFTYNGEKKLSLHEIKNTRGEFISKNNANFLAAAVDNVKDNTLYATNQNTFTGDVSMLLSRLGYDPVEIAILMRQPIVVEMTNRYFRENREGVNAETIIQKVLQEYTKKAGFTEGLVYDSYKDNKFLIEDLIDNIIIAKDATAITNRNQTNDWELLSFYKKQVSIGYLFSKIYATANALSNVVSATRADTAKGGSGPDIANTIIKANKVSDLMIESSNRKYPLVGVESVITEINTSVSVDNIREQLLSRKLPILQAFYSLGLKHSEVWLGKFFPHFQESFKEVLDGKYEIIDGEPVLIAEGLRRMTKSGRLDAKTISSIYNDLISYIMTKSSFFGSEISGTIEEDNITIKTSEDKRREFIINFPSTVKKIIAENEDIASLEFIKRLKIIKSNDKNPVDVLVFKNVGSLNSILKERYSRDWASLLYMNNPVANQLALDLFRYNFYRNGLSFGPSTFAHLAPIAVRESIPGYIDTLREMLNSNDSYEEFIYQYIYNHLDNRRLVPLIPEDASTKFSTKEGDILDEVTFEISENSSSSDNKVVKSKMLIPGTKDFMYEFFTFISKKVKGKSVYYRLVPNTTIEPNIATYRRIEPLGYKDSFLEYQYGVSVDEMISVIDNNKKDYDPVAEAAAMHSSKELTEEDYMNMPTSFIDETVDSITQYDKEMEEAFGFTRNSTPDFDTYDLSTATPDPDFRDANDERLCGSKKTDSITIGIL